MFPIVSLLMHKTRTHKQNGTGHDYEPTQELHETRTRTHTHTRLRRPAQPEQWFSLPQTDFFAAGVTHHCRSRNNATCMCGHTGRRKPPDEHEGQCTEEYTQEKEKEMQPLFPLTLYFGCRGKSSNDKISKNPNPEEEMN